MQGDIIGLLDSNGTQVVKYTYDAWGKPTSKSGTMKNTLGAVQPFRYRGYVFDEETDLYYLRSRYYNPARCRFATADSVMKKPYQLMENNLYAYCGNRIITKADADGTDAYWLTDTGNVGGLGHTSLLLEDNDGVWYYFYWGPEAGTIPLRTQAKVMTIRVPVTFQQNGMLDLDELNRTLNKNGGAIYGRTYNMATRYTGDYSKSVNYAKLLRKTYEDSLLSGLPAYGVLFSNCMQASAAVMQASNPIVEKPLLWTSFACLARYTIPSFVGWLLQATGMPTVVSEGMGVGLEIPE